MASETITIGRGDSCDIVLADRSVSRNHAEVVLDRNGQMFITDCQSACGVFIVRGGEKEKISQGRVPRNADVAFGDFVLSADELLELVMETLEVLAQQKDSGNARYIRCQACGTPKPEGTTCPICSTDTRGV